jgi:Na+-translocating ferredoxin:NAD+ oxidoreductase RnfG subunit
VKRIFSILLLGFVLSGFDISDRIDKLISKEIRSVFEVDNFSEEGVAIPNENNANLPLSIHDENFFKIYSDQDLLGYYYFGKAFGKADYFDFIVIFDRDLIVSKIKVLVYREGHGGEIASKRWLKQFNGRTADKHLTYQKDIAAISGATISAKSMTREVNKLLQSIRILNNKNQL